MSRKIGPATTGATVGSALSLVICQGLAIFANVEVTPEFAGSLAIVLTAVGGLLAPPGGGKRVAE